MQEVELQVSEMKMQAMRERLIVNLTMTGDSIRRNQQHILNMIQQASLVCKMRYVL